VAKGVRHSPVQTLLRAAVAPFRCAALPVDHAETDEAE